MKQKFVLLGVLGSVLMFGTLVCHAVQAVKWDKNNFKDAQIASGYYDEKSITVKDDVVSWTEKYLLTDDGISFFNAKLSKYEPCKSGIAKNGKVTQFQLEYQIQKNMYRGAAKRYYNKSNQLICTDKDTGNDFNAKWQNIVPRSPIMNAKYDLVSKYKVKFP